MKIQGANITISRSSLFVLEPPDAVEDCIIQVKKSEPGVDRPIVIKSGATFQRNLIASEIAAPISLDSSAGKVFLEVHGNCFMLTNSE